jgi:hypothetical protein
MQRIDVLDTLENITNKVDYLFSSTYFMMLAQKNGHIDFKSEELMGFGDLSNGLLEELKTYYNELKPHLKDLD